MHLIAVQEPMRSVLRWSTWICLSVMVWTVAAESRHNHPRPTDAATCSICVAAHSASPAAASNPSKPLFAAVGRLQEKEVIAKSRLEVFELVIRGPPMA
jgi:hypothetical protein